MSSIVLVLGQLKPPKLFLLLTVPELPLLDPVGSAVGKVRFTLSLARAIQPEGFATQARECTGKCCERGHWQHDGGPGRK